MNDQPTHEEYGTRFLGEKIQRIAAGLRDLADAVERRTDEIGRVGRPGLPSYARIAQDVQHEVLWWLANLHLDSLTTDAYEADYGRLTAAKAEEG